jgi:putative oxidoreductase
MGSLGMPAAGLLLAGAILLEIGGGLALVTGFQAKYAAWRSRCSLCPSR